jgi:hypothetical protein
MATAHRVYQGDRAHGFPLGRNYAVLREQRDPSAERILVKVKPALASSLARVSHLTCVSRSRKSPSAPHIHSLLTELFPLGIGVAREFIGQSPRMESSWLTCSGGWSQAMSEFARTPIEPARAFPPASTGSPIGSTDFANEKHYSINEIAKLWALSEKTVRRIFQREPGVIHWSREETLHKRGYRTLRVPETVLHRVHRKLRKAS